MTDGEKTAYPWYSGIMIGMGVTNTYSAMTYVAEGTRYADWMAFACIAVAFFLFRSLHNRNVRIVNQKDSKQ